MHWHVPAERWCVTREDLDSFLEVVRDFHHRGLIHNDEDPRTGLKNPSHDDPYIGPNIHAVNKYVIKPLTLAKGKGASWALMQHKDGLPIDFFVTHNWAEGIYEFYWKVTQSWPPGLKNMWCCFLANPQAWETARLKALLGSKSDLSDSPFARALDAGSCRLLLVVPNAVESIYKRLWCVEEARRAIKKRLPVWCATDQGILNWPVACRNVEDAVKLVGSNSLRRMGAWSPLAFEARDNAERQLLSQGTFQTVRLASCTDKDDELRIRAFISNMVDEIDEMIQDLARKGQWLPRPDKSSLSNLSSSSSSSSASSVERQPGSAPVSEVDAATATAPERPRAFSSVSPRPSFSSCWSARTSFVTEFDKARLDTGGEKAAVAPLCAASPGVSTSRSKQLSDKRLMGCKEPPREEQAAVEEKGREREQEEEGEEGEVCDRDQQEQEQEEEEEKEKETGKARKELMSGLATFLSSAQLAHYYQAAVSWCAAVGVTELRQVFRRAERLFDALEFKPLERRRFDRRARECNNNSAGNNNHNNNNNNKNDENDENDEIDESNRRQQHENNMTGTNSLRLQRQELGLVSTRRDAPGVVDPKFVVVTSNSQQLLDSPIKQHSAPAIATADVVACPSYMLPRVSIPAEPSDAPQLW